MPKTAFITGITGQDGAYLSALLLDKGYTVHGLQRRSSLSNTSRLTSQINNGLHLHYGDMTDGMNLARLLSKIQPDEVYNLAAQSHVQVSFDTAEYTGNTDGLGVTRLLESMRVVGLTQIKFFQASSSELFGKVSTPLQNETTPFYPRSPYGVAKLYGYWMTVNAREAYGLFASNGVMFNHESPLRGEEFVTRKITRAVAAIKQGGDEVLMLGNLNARRDWSHAADMMRGAWQILQHTTPDDFVLASGIHYSVRDFVERAFACVDIGIEWSGEGVNEVGRDSRTGKPLVHIDPKFFRPSEVDMLCGDSTKARTILKWAPSVSFDGLVKDMVYGDLSLYRRD